VELNRAARESDQLKEVRADREAVAIRQGRADEPDVAGRGDHLLWCWSGSGIGWRQDQTAGMESSLV
jgi:hypothetical protein